VVEVDLGPIESRNKAAREALAEAGSIGILVNSAGVALIDPLIEAAAARWHETMAVNLRAPFWFAQTVAPGMIAD
jgi:2-deoxy-D-gluconate 3-dehydrogenase